MGNLKEQAKVSCFSEPALQDVILAAPLSSNDAESIISPEGLKCQPEPRASSLLIEILDAMTLLRFSLSLLWLLRRFSLLLKVVNIILCMLS